MNRTIKIRLKDITITYEPNSMSRYTATAYIDGYRYRMRYDYKPTKHQAQADLTSEFWHMLYTESED